MLRTILLAMLLFPAVVKMAAQSLTAPEPAAALPPILGSLEKGTYSNPVLGFELQVGPGCAFSDEAESVAESRRLPRRLGLNIQCENKLLVIISFPLEPDEKLEGATRPSLAGVEDGGGYKKVGNLKTSNVGGNEVLTQELRRHGEKGEESAFYNAFVVGRGYVVILVEGPKANKPDLQRTLSELQFLPKPAK